MTIILNTDKNISGNERLETYVNSVIAEELSRFEEHITRIEVHLSDENGAKEGSKDKRCMLEARLKNKQPIAVTSHGDTLEKSLTDAIGKLKTSLDKANKRS
jgi:ribosome-associated translation inhibitor RaiA